MFLVIISFLLNHSAAPYSALPGSGNLNLDRENVLLSRTECSCLPLPTVISLKGCSCGTRDPQEQHGRQMGVCSRKRELMKAAPSLPLVEFLRWIQPCICGKFSCFIWRKFSETHQKTLLTNKQTNLQDNENCKLRNSAVWGFCQECWGSWDIS